MSLGHAFIVPLPKALANPAAESEHLEGADDGYSLRVHVEGQPGVIVWAEISEWVS
jgi:hypothetical protein